MKLILFHLRNLKFIFQINLGSVCLRVSPFCHKLKIQKVINFQFKISEGNFFDFLTFGKMGPP